MISSVQESLKRDYEYLLWLLARRDYPEKKLREKLKAREVSVADSDTLLERLKEAGYFSEARFRRARIRQLTRRGDGPRALKAKLKVETGNEVTTSEIEDVYQELGTSDLEVLAAYLQKEFDKLSRSGRHDDKTVRQKLTERALRKGFGYDQAKRALQQIGAA
jgi:SOS response regulatory protein OraA/RecX